MAAHTSASPPDEDLSPEIVNRYIKKFNTATAGAVKRYTQESLDWFRKRVSKDLNVRQSQLLQQHVYQKRSGKEDGRLIGKLYFFEYAAEEAGDAELGVYDRYPLVFFFNATKSKDGKLVLWGLNMHYLAPRERMIFFLELLKVKTNKAGVYTPKTKLRITWQIIKGIAKKSFAEKAVHAYRVDRLQSKLIEIPAQDWEICVFIPLQKWVEVDKSKKGFTQSHLRKQITKKSKKL